MSTTALATACELDPEIFEPTGSLQWLGDGALWVGATTCENETEFVLIHRRPEGNAEIIAALGGPQMCRLGSAQRIYALGIGRSETVTVTGQNLQITTLPDAGLELENCAFAAARERDRLVQSGFAGLTAVGLGSGFELGRSDIGELRLLGCRPAEKPEASEILLFVGADRPLSVTVDWPLARDNPILTADSNTGGWLVYPSLTFARRHALEGIVPGVPVCRIGTELEMSLTWVPWDEWNRSGPYRFYPLGTGLVAAMSLGWTDEGERLSGIYMPDGNHWLRRFSGQVDVSSLTASPDGKNLAWREQIKVDSPDARYGKLRYLARIEYV